MQGLVEIMHEFTNLKWCNRRKSTYPQHCGAIKVNDAGISVKSSILEEPTKKLSESGLESTDESDPAAGSCSDTEMSSEDHQWRSNPELDVVKALEDVTGFRSKIRPGGPITKTSLEGKARPFVPFKPPPGLDDAEDTPAFMKRRLATASKEKSSSRHSEKVQWGMELRDTMVALSQKPKDTLLHKWRGPDEENWRQPRDPNKLATVQAIRGRAPEVLPNDENSFRANMRKMSKVDPERIFMVRKIAKLGFNSDHFLTAHFKQFGTVEQVFVSHSIDKSCPVRDRPRIRPAGVAFVVMSKVEESVRAINDGGEHIVHGVNICVCKYECQQPHDADAI
jgi:hypothetical protein